MSTTTRPGSLLALLAPLLVSLAGLVIVACGGGGAPPPPEGEPPPPQPAPFGLDARPTLAPLGFPADGATVQAVDFEPAFSNLSFTRPVYLTNARDGTDWIYVVEQGGRILVFPNDDTVTSASVFLDLSAAAGGPVSRAGNEEGLLGLCFDPAYRTNGYVYVHFSAASPRRSVIARYTATFPMGAAPVATAGSFHEILSVDQPASNHNAGMLEFGPDDMLYIGFGDGGSGGDPWGAIGNGQNTGTRLGSMLRIDVRGSTTAQRFAVPSDNPYTANAAVLDEIWAYGLRNPWRFSFDRDTGDLIVGDVGQGTREEVSLIRKGDNLGWRIREGTTNHNVPTGGVPSGLREPIVDYARSEGTTVVGGYVYRGQDVPSLSGVYVYGDYGSGRIWGLTHTDGTLVANDQIQSLSGVVSFGEDERGELYAVSLGGSIRRFREPVGGTPTSFPTLLSETGLFTDVATLTPAAGLIEYDVNAPLWSDGAFKRRWIALPNGQRIAFSSAAPWSFPVGTVLVKHFELELTVGDPGSRRRLETRALIHEADGWAGYTWRWNDAQTDAVLLTDALDENFTIDDPLAPGGMREQTWTYPSRTDCLQCHTESAGRVLSVRTGQLNRAFDYAAATDNQLRTWNHIGLFTTDIGAADTHEAWADPDDTTASLQERARAYLASNCAGCHRANGTAPGNLDLSWSVPNAAMGALGVAPLQGGLGLTSPAIIAPGAKERSVLWERMRRLDGTRMPRLGTSEVHGAAVDLIGQWIDGL